MPHRIFLAEFIEVRVEFFRRQMKMVVQKSAQVGVPVGGVRDDLDAVASRDHHRLFDSRIRRQIAAGIRQARFRDRQPLPHFQRSALVIHADELESHEAPNLCIVEK